LSAWYCANVEVARSRGVVSCLIQVTLMASWHTKMYSNRKVRGRKERKYTTQQTHHYMLSVIFESLVQPRKTP
jgi:hypothetical protein